MRNYSTICIEYSFLWKNLILYCFLFFISNESAYFALCKVAGREYMSGCGFLAKAITQQLLIVLPHGAISPDIGFNEMIS